MFNGKLKKKIAQLEEQLKLANLTIDKQSKTIDKQSKTIVDLRHEIMFPPKFQIGEKVNDMIIVSRKPVISGPYSVITESLLLVGALLLIATKKVKPTAATLNELEKMRSNRWNYEVKDATGINVVSEYKLLLLKNKK